jgi:cob(I)alamin adenosyltransferase
MPRITRIYTRTGDGGTTRLAGGQEVAKDSRRIEAYGTVDELNSTIGAALAAGVDSGLASELRRIQNELFHLGADLAVREEDKPRVPGPRIEPRHVEALERLLDTLTVELGPLENFILPGGSPGAALLHVARTVCRRAERLVVALSHDEAIGPSTLQYVNRLSDALFAMARAENRRRGVPESLWDSKA